MNAFLNYKLLLRPRPQHLQQGLTAQVQGLFDVNVIPYAPGDLVNLISSREAKNGGSEVELYK